MKLLILISLCFVGMAETSRCVHQVSTRTVQPGGSVTIPCSYFTDEEPHEDVKIFWHETKDELCENVKWIVSLSGGVDKKYKGRLHREQDPIKKGTEFLTITGLNHTDGPRFCCQLHNIKSDYSIKIDTLGTRLLFPDEEHVTQLDELIAVSGEEVIIPCYYSKDSSNITHVAWSFADSANDNCIWIHTWNRDDQYGRYSLVNFSRDISLRIHNIQANEENHFCCAVYTPGEINTKQRTHVIIADHQASWDQMTEEITVQEGHSVILTCSHTIPNGRYTERNVIRVNVYWRVGNVTGPYAYHPYQEMVHSIYLHRTSKTGMTSLIINNVTKADNTSFHCFVVVKLCASDDFYKDNIEYGGGTKLIINDFPDGEDGDSTLLLIVIALSSVIILIILIGVLILLKMKGVICKKNPHSFEHQMVIVQAKGDGICEDAPYCEINTKKPEDTPRDAEVDKKGVEGGQMEELEDGNLLYAKLNKDKLKEKHPVELPQQKEEVVYAAVVNTNSN